MNTNFSRLIGVFALAALVQSAHAELKWEQTSVDLRPGFNDKQAVAHFKYENVGNTPVHFKSVHASCGCTTAQTQNEQVGPGQKGEITATFNIGGRTGTQVRLLLQTDDPDPRAPLLCPLKASYYAVTRGPTSLFIGRVVRANRIITAKANKDTPPSKLDIASSLPISLPKSTPVCRRIPDQCPTSRYLQGCLRNLDHQTRFAAEYWKHLRGGGAGDASCANIRDCRYAVEQGCRFHRPTRSSHASADGRIPQAITP